MFKLIIWLIIIISILLYSCHFGFGNKELVLFYSPNADIKVVKKQTEKCLIEQELNVKQGPKGNVQISYS